MFFDDFGAEAGDEPRRGIGRRRVGRVGRARRGRCALRRLVGSAARSAVGAGRVAAGDRRSASGVSKSCGAHDERGCAPSRGCERVLDRAALPCGSAVDRVEALPAARRTRSTPFSMPIGCASWIAGAHRRLQRLERVGPRFDHVVERRTSSRRRGRLGRRRLGRGSAAGVGRGLGRRAGGAPASGAGARREHRTVGRGRRARRRRRRSARARPQRGRGAPSASRCFEPFDAVEQRLFARARLAAREAHDRDFEHEPRVGDRPGRGCRRSPARGSRCRARARRCPSPCASAASRAASSAGPS